MSRKEHRNKKKVNTTTNVVSSNPSIRQKDELPKLLITGSSGFIGASFIEAYKHHYQIIGIDRRLNKTSGIEFIHDDINNITKYKQRLIKIDGIIHLAAVSRVITAEESVDDTWETNVAGLQNILNLCQKLNHSPFVILGSSREVYGEPAEFPVREIMHCLPINRYGISKLAAEELVYRYHRETKANVAILRFSNVYGNLKDQMDRVIPKFIRLAMKNRPLQLQGRMNSFDFTHIDDTIHAIDLSIGKLLESSPLGIRLNICTGDRTTLNQLAKLIVNLTESSSNLIDAPPRSYDVKHFQGSYELAKELLKYRPTVPLKEGLRSLIDKIRDKPALQEVRT